MRFLLDELCDEKKIELFFAKVDIVDEVDARTTDDRLALVLPLLLLVVVVPLVLLLSSSSTSLSLNNSTTRGCIRPLSGTEEGGGSDPIEDDADGEVCNGGGAAVCVDELHTIGGGGGKPAGLVHCPIFHVSW